MARIVATDLVENQFPADLVQELRDVEINSAAYFADGPDDYDIDRMQDRYERQFGWD